MSVISQHKQVRLILDGQIKTVNFKVIKASDLSNIDDLVKAQFHVASNELILIPKVKINEVSDSVRAFNI